MNENKKSIKQNAATVVSEAERDIQKAPNGNQVTIVEPQGSGEEQEAARATFWQGRFNTAADVQRPMQERWGKWYEQMYAVVNDQDMAAWRSKVFIPLIASKVWDLIARFIQYKPGWEVSIRSMPNSMDNAEYASYIEKMNEKYDKVALKLDYDYDNPMRDTPMQDELQSVMLDAAVTGMGLARVPYDDKVVTDKQHIERGDLVDLSLEEITVSHQGYNGFSAINIFNAYFAPGAADLQRASWLIIKDYAPLSELQSRDNYKNLDKIKAGVVTDDTARYQSGKNSLLASPDQLALDTTQNMVELYECWDRESKMVTVYAKAGDGWIEIYRMVNIYWHEKYPFVAFYIRRKPHIIWGESLFENTETLQNAANDVFNHYIDSLNMSDGMMAIEEGSVVEPFIVEPGGEFRYRGEAPKQWKFPEPNPAQLQTVTGHILQAVENATISQYASGVPNSSTDSTQGTATGITRLMEAAAEKVGMMRSNFRRSFNQVGVMWLSNTQQFMDSDILTEKKTGQGKMIEVIRPIDMTGVFNLKIDDGSFEPVSKDEQRSNYMTYVANLQTWSSASVEQAQRTGDMSQVLNVDYNSVALRGSELYGENFNNFILPAVAETQVEGGEEQDPILQAEQMLAEEGVPAEPADGADAIAATESIQPANNGVAIQEGVEPALQAATPRTVGAAGALL